MMMLLVYHSVDETKPATQVFPETRAIVTSDGEVLWVVHIDNSRDDRVNSPWVRVCDALVVWSVNHPWMIWVLWIVPEYDTLWCVKCESSLNDMSVVGCTWGRHTVVCEVWIILEWYECCGLCLQWLRAHVALTSRSFRLTNSAAHSSLARGPTTVSRWTSSTSAHLVTLTSTPPAESGIWSECPLSGTSAAPNTNCYLFTAFLRVLYYYSVNWRRYVHRAFQQKH